LVQIYHFLITSNIPFSALIMVAIAVDRYLCICHPWQSAQLMNQARAKLVVTALGDRSPCPILELWKLVVTALALFAALIGICVALMYGVYRPINMPHNFDNLTTAQLTAIVLNADKYVTTPCTTSG